MNQIKNKISLLLITIVCVLQTNCSFKDENTVVFKNDLTGMITDENANRLSQLNEWSVTDDRIECLVSNENRKLKLKTKQLGTQKGVLEMTVRVGFFNQAISEQNNNWAGFSINPKETKISKVVDKQRSGIKIGVCTNGALFIGEPSLNNVNQDIVNILPKGLDLKIVVTPVENYYTIDFSTFDAQTGTILANISKKYITQDQLIGQLELVSNFESLESGKINNLKSVWFEDWVIKGSKVNHL